MHKIKTPHIPVNFYFTTNWKKYKKETEYKGKKVKGLCTFDGASSIYIGVFDNELHTLVHELFHAMIYANEIFDSNTITRYNHEHYAYLQDYLFKKISKIS